MGKELIERRKSVGFNDDGIRITGVEIDDQYASDIMTNAIEGGQTVYWLNEECKRLKDGTATTRIERAKAGIDPDSLDELSVRHIWFEANIDGKGWKAYSIGLPEIKSAVRRMVRQRNGPIEREQVPGKRYCHPRIIDAILNGDPDAEASDCVLQVAAFDEVIFG